MVFKELVEKCRSTRRFDGKYKMSEDTIVELLKLARMTPSAKNQQALRFLVSNTSETNDKIFSATKWASDLINWQGPKENERPSAFVIILGDKKITDNFYGDHCLAAYAILLGAAEMGLGGCMLGALNREKLYKDLEISTEYEILIVVALGKPAETIVLEDAVNGKTKYYRTADDAHHVPKRLLADLLHNRS
jgi:nitroreductase